MLFQLCYGFHYLLPLTESRPQVIALCKINMGHMWGTRCTMKQWESKMVTFTDFAHNKNNVNHLYVQFPNIAVLQVAGFFYVQSGRGEKNMRKKLSSSSLQKQISGRNQRFSKRNLSGRELLSILCMK